MKSERLVGVMTIACIAAGAGLVSANPCFDNQTVNSCTRLPPVDPESNDCYVFASNNGCSQYYSTAIGLLTVGQPTTSECRFYPGKVGEEGCEMTGAPQQSSTVQCTPAAGGACPVGGGEG